AERRPPAGAPPVPHVAPPQLPHHPGDRGGRHGRGRPPARQRRAAAVDRGDRRGALRDPVRPAGPGAPHPGPEVQLHHLRRGEPLARLSYLDAAGNANPTQAGRRGLIRPYHYYTPVRRRSLLIDWLLSLSTQLGTRSGGT